MKKVMKIEGMSCHHCSGRVEEALNSIRGVNAEVILEEGIANITLTKDIPDEKLIKAVSDAGYTVVSLS